MNPPDTLIDDLRVLEPPDPLQYVYIVGGILLAVLVIFLLRSLIRSIRRRRALDRSGEIAAAQEDALQELQKLFSLVEEAQSRPYAIESSGIVRRYIERRFALRAPTQSTEEFLHDVQQDPTLSAGYQELLAAFLRCCDYIKFGRGQATREELAELHTSAVQFVQSTSSGGGQG